jgi:hypothetical protein
MHTPFILEFHYIHEQFNFEKLALHSLLNEMKILKNVQEWLVRRIDF